MKFTVRGIDALKPSANRYDVLESGGRGFGVRVAPSGRKSWIYLYHHGGRLRRMTLGTYPEMSLAEAHQAHASARAAVKRGEDPGAGHVQIRLEALKAPTVAQLAHEYLERWAKPHKRSWGEDVRVLNKDVLPIWGRRRAAEIRRRDVIALLDEVSDRGARVQANRTLACIRKMFNFALARDLIETNPCTMVKAPGKEHRRDRILSVEEIHRFWTGLSKAPMRPITALALKLQLVTAQRRGEVLSMRWEDISDNLWTVPAERSKNGLPHRVPLSPLALALLGEAKQLAKSPWVFPGLKPAAHFSGDSVDHALQSSREVIQLSDLTPHDLRRTAASHMTGMGISRLVVAKILNHAESGITAVYDRHSYDVTHCEEMKHHGSDTKTERTARLGRLVQGNSVALRARQFVPPPSAHWPPSGRLGRERDQNLARHTPARTTAAKCDAT
jgi:integrase